MRKKNLSQSTIFNGEYDWEYFYKKRPQEYLKVIQWGRKNPVAFIEKFLQVQLTDYQKYIITGMWTAKSICLTCSRAAGKSFLSAVYLMARTILFPSLSVAIIAPDGRQSKMLLQKCEDIATHNLGTIKNQSNVFINETVKNTSNSNGFHHAETDYVQLYNGSKITTFNSDPTRNVGFRANIIVYDEAGKIPDLVFQLSDPFIAVAQFATGNVNIDCYPEQLPNQRILLSSAESKQTELWKTYKLCALKMLEGDFNYFVVDITCELPLHPTMNGKPCTPLLEEGVIKDAMLQNEVKALREYYNIFDNNDSEDSVISRSAIERSMHTYTPEFESSGVDEHYMISYDPAEKIDNSFVLICKYWRDPDLGWKMRVVNGINFIEVLPNGEKKVLNKPQQIEEIKKLMLKYNASKYGGRDWDQIHLIIDPGAGGGGYTIAQYLLNEWTDDTGVLRCGIIDQFDPYLSQEAQRHPDNKKILTLTPTRQKNRIYADLTDAINQKLVEFPSPLNIRNEFEWYEVQQNGQQSIKYIKASKEELRAMTEIDLMITEVTSMTRTATPSGGLTIKLAPGLPSRMHDDRAYTMAMACGYLMDLRREDLLFLEKGESAWRQMYTDRLQDTQRRHDLQEHKRDFSAMSQSTSSAIKTSFGLYKK